MEDSLTPVNGAYNLFLLPNQVKRFSVGDGLLANVRKATGGLLPVNVYQQPLRIGRAPVFLGVAR